MKKIFFIAGEASGDLHGSNLIKEIKINWPDIELVGWGGPLMEKEGMRLRSDYKKRAFMGLWEVIKNLRTILHFIKECKQHIIEEVPDALVCIDNPGFNMRIAKWASQNGMEVHYYILPKAWAWKKKRALELRKYRNYSILPFEKSFFDKMGVRTEYVGNPVRDAVLNFKLSGQAAEIIESEKPIVALLPGSRKQEVEKLLPVMLQMIPYFPQYQFVLAATTALDTELYKKFLSNEDLFIEYDNTYKVLNSAQYALVASGTATLETALFKVPQIVCYITSKFTYIIGKQLVKISYISLVNLIANRKVVTELIQDECTLNNLIDELHLLEKNSQNIVQDYEAIAEQIGEQNASKTVANEMIVGH